MPPRRFLRLAGALLIGAAGGWAFFRLGTPLPWMLGPLFAVAACNLAGLGLVVPTATRRGGQWVVGTALGLYFTPEAVARMVDIGPSLIIGTVVTIALGLGYAWALRRFGGADGATAFFGGAIGGAAEMAVQGERNGGSVQLITAGHTLRLIIVVTVIPFSLYGLGIHGDEAYLPPATQVDPIGLAWLVLLTGAGGWLGMRCRLPNAFVLGPLFSAGVISLAGLQPSALPGPLINLGQLLLGVAIGSRFEPGFFRTAPRYLTVIAISSLLAILVSLGLALALSWLPGLPLPTLVLANAPGGVAEMSLTAKVLQLGVPIVTAFHVLRFVVLLLSVATLYRWLANRFGWPQVAARPR